jgi:glutamine amidotransferase
MYPEREIFGEVGPDARLIVSEPVGDLPGAWAEIPESSYGVAGGGDDDALFAFKPVEP